MRLLIASTNERKISWFKKVFEVLPEELEIVTLEDIGYKLRIQECGSSYEVNAIMKAVEPMMLYPDLITVADDGGIEFEGTNMIGGLMTGRHIGDFSRDVLTFLMNHKGLYGESKKSRVCSFVGSVAVAWRDKDGSIVFSSIPAHSPASLRVIDVRPEVIPENSDCYAIIERMYSDRAIKLEDMNDLMLMDSVGVLEPYTRTSWFIQNRILKGVYN